MKGTTQGFTLIELLIVIAIIGILAAVLIPNLLNARKSAGAKAAQAHSANVYKAAVATLAEDSTVTMDNVISYMNGNNCKAKFTPTTSAPYGWADGGSAVSSCAITVSGTDFAVTVVAASEAGGKTYINGAQQ